MPKARLKDIELEFEAGLAPDEPLDLSTIEHLIPDQAALNPEQFLLALEETGHLRIEVQRFPSGFTKLNLIISFGDDDK